MAHTHPNRHDPSKIDSTSEAPGLTDDPEFELAAPQSFILKVWLVQDTSELPPGWHGRMTHVASGHHVHVRSFIQVVWFLAEYLDAMGVRLPLILRLYRRLSRLRPIKRGS